MTDGPGSTPDVPSGWAAEQPPPYGGATGSWASPGGGVTGGGQERPADPPRLQPGTHTYHTAYPQPNHQPNPHPPGPYGHRPPDAPRPGIIPLRPLTLGDILDGAIKLIRSNPKATLGLSAVVAAITTIPAALGQAVTLSTIGDLVSDPSIVDSTDVPLGGVAAQYIGAIISYVMTFVGTTVLTGILTRVLGRAVFGGRVTAGEAWRLVRSRILALFGLVLLQGLILVLPLLALLAVLVTLAAADVLGTWGGAGAGTAAALVLLFAVIYIPYLLFFYTRFSLAAPAIVLEGRGVVDAMSRSWRLVKGGSWRVLGILLLTTVLAMILSSVLAVPFTVGGVVLGMLGGGAAAATVLTALLLAAGNVLAAMITYPFQAGVAGLLYADRRMRAEAFDLVLQTAAARNQSQGWIHADVDDLWHPSQAAGTGPTSGPGG